MRTLREWTVGAVSPAGRVGVKVEALSTWSMGAFYGQSMPPAARYACSGLRGRPLPWQPEAVARYNLRVTLVRVLSALIGLLMLAPSLASGQT